MLQRKQKNVYGSYDFVDFTGGDFISTSVVFFFFDLNGIHTTENSFFWPGLILSTKSMSNMNTEHTGGDSLLS